ncbi:MAG TPA: hypothetical protein VFX38_04260, partial [Gammaproteobacteria bacterium]|nr:hypothetical protein [Gammaproteobacteria bacterium]
MKRFTAWLAAGTAAAAFLCAGGLRAAEPAPVNVTMEFDDTVAPAQVEAYEAGIKNFEQCLGQHGFKYAVVALRHVTGDQGQYSYGITV